MFLKRKYFLISILILFCIPAFAKSKKYEVYEKEVHPREYKLDLCDFKSQVFLGYNPKENLFTVYIDITDFLIKDLPQAGDKISFYFSGTSSRDAKDMYAKLIIDGKTEVYEDRLFATDVISKQPFEGFVSYVITEDAEKKIELKLFSDMPNRRGKLDQTFFRFKRVIDSTNTVKEAEAEQKAIRKNIEIKEVQSEIVDDYAQKIEAAKEQLEAERLENERREAERLEKENQERLEKQMQLALEKEKQKNAAKNQKEYLSDYILPDTYEIEKNNDSDLRLKNPDETDAGGVTLLMKAARLGNEWQVKRLLDSSANTNLKDKDGWTALMYAVRYNEALECVELLINSGANIKIANRYGLTALTMAATYNNNPQILSKLLQSYKPSDKEVQKALVFLLSEQSISEDVLLSKLQILLDTAMPVNILYDGKTPLMYAAAYGNSTRVIKILLEYGASVTIRSSDGKTAFDYASENNNLAHDETYWALNVK